MCGRLILYMTFSEIAAAMDIGSGSPAPNVKPSWNTGPTQDALVIYLHPETRKRVGENMRFGIIPRWAEDGRMKFTNHAARAETVREKPMFRDLWREGKRCLIVTNGFYEWREHDKQPFAMMARAQSKITALAGLWETWRDPKSGEVIKSCCVITTTANSLIEPFDDRMPVILDEKDWPLWLGEVPWTHDQAYALLRSYPSDEMDLWPVSKRVGKISQNDADLMKPITLDDIRPFL
jgi:putative SOS response-associated peptidase YedK